MTRSLWAVPVAMLMTGCSGNNPCDVMTVDASFLGTLPECSDAGPCTGEIDVKLTYGNVAEPTMTLVLPISMGAEREVKVSTSMHRAILNEGDSFPNRSISAWLFNPANGTRTFEAKDFTEDQATLVDKSTYTACNVQDEELIALSFDAANSTVTPP